MLGLKLNHVSNRGHRYLWHFCPVVNQRPWAPCHKGFISSSSRQNLVKSRQNSLCWNFNFNGRIRSHMTINCYDAGKYGNSLNNFNQNESKITVKIWIVMGWWILCVMDSWPKHVWPSKVKVYIFLVSHRNEMGYGDWSPLIIPAGTHLIPKTSSRQCF